MSLRNQKAAEAQPRSVRMCLAAMMLLAGAATAFGADHAAPAAGKATDYAATDSHPGENVVIAAEPFETPDKAKFFRVDYLKYGFLPIRVIITNNGDQAVNLTDARIQFLSAAGDRIPAALTEEVGRVVDKPSNPASPGVKLPFPVPNIHGRSNDKDKQINDDFNMLGFQALAVEPHTTQSGFLFYDVNGLDKPVLKGAQLYVKRLHGSGGKDLFDFAIPFNKFLAAPAHK